MSRSEHGPGAASVERCSKISERRQDLADERAFGFHHRVFGDHPCAVAFHADCLDTSGSCRQVQTESVPERTDPTAR